MHRNDHLTPFSNECYPHTFPRSYAIDMFRTILT